MELKTGIWICIFLIIFGTTSIYSSQLLSKTEHTFNFNSDNESNEIFRSLINITENSQRLCTGHYNISDCIFDSTKEELWCMN